MTQRLRGTDTLAAVKTLPMSTERSVREAQSPETSMPHAASVSRAPNQLPVSVDWVSQRSVQDPSSAAAGEARAMSTTRTTSTTAVG